MDRVFYHYEDLEEYHAGMWRIKRGEERKNYIAAAALLMQNPLRFCDAMKRAVQMWPRSCEAAFTAESVNQIAWLGHAGTCIETGSPEECTRAAWHTLNKAEQDAANAVAAEARATWQASYVAPIKMDLFSAADISC